jgi:hypothetical protein
MLELPRERFKLDPMIFLIAPAMAFLNLPMAENNTTTSENLAVG